ncbi:MAG: adenine-specific DNA-methyltransferase [Sphingomonadales bacterium]|nr:adenine-specific DNA-methyltransferase [Sphingomonadales bacterium]
MRKTGIGLNAAIDVTGAYTNQVVFEYALRASAAYSFSYLHYVLGVLSSRILFAFHLKRGGELEWRSHPYVTQKTLAALPIPLPRPGSQGERQAAAIAAVVAEHLATGDKEIEIEALVGGLYGLDGGDIEWVLDVLDGAADLDAMRRLRLASRTAIQPLTVG